MKFPEIKYIVWSGKLHNPSPAGARGFRCGGIVVREVAVGCWPAEGVRAEANNPKVV